MVNTIVIHDFSAVLCRQDRVDGRDAGASGDLCEPPPWLREARRSAWVDGWSEGWAEAMNEQG